MYGFESRFSLFTSDEQSIHWLTNDVIGNQCSSCAVTLTQAFQMSQTKTLDVVHTRHIARGFKAKMIQFTDYCFVEINFWRKVVQINVNNSWNTWKRLKLTAKWVAYCAPKPCLISRSFAHFTCSFTIISQKAPIGAYVSEHIVELYVCELLSNNKSIKIKLI